ncbi:HAD family hydrolase [Sphingomonas antarctica]|uniref:pyrimidine 5'-nucleotidase n=1 Tax=Sphingomonas antarctica TaxID=2040274 RepID=UPI0039E9CCFC
MTPDLDHIRAWIFDLDNTLYPAKTDLFALIDARMTAYVSRLLDLPHDEARAVQKSYFADHGTTMRGLMDNHGVEAAEFLDDVHDIELDRIAEDQRLVAQIAALPGRKLVFTNGDATYASRVLERLGLGASFDGIHDIHAMGLIPKPAASAYAGLCDRWGVDPHTALFVDDMARNLAPAKALGMTTVWLDNGSEQAAKEPFTTSCPSYVDLRIEDLSDWLDTICGNDA